MPNRTVEHVAVYRWRKSGSGYVAEPTGLDGSAVMSAQVNPYPNQPSDLSIIVTFNARGKELLDQLTTAIASQATVDSRERHLPVLVGLTNEQVANWADPAVQSKALMPIEQGGNLLSDAVVLQPFTGDQLVVYYGADLPTACSLSAKSSATRAAINSDRSSPDRLGALQL